MIPHNFHPGVPRFVRNDGSVNGQYENSTTHQVSAPLSPYLEARLENLEQVHGDLREDVNTLKDLYHDMYNTFTPVKQHHRSNGLALSRESAMSLRKELEQLSREIRAPMNGDADDQKADDAITPKASGSVSSQVEAASVVSHGSRKSLPPHLRGRKQVDAVNGNGYVLRT